MAGKAASIDHYNSRNGRLRRIARLAGSSRRTHRAPIKLNPYVARHAVLSPYVIAETAKPQVNHDHLVSEERLHPIPNAS